MRSGRNLKRENAFTELSLPGAQTIVLGPLPPPTLPPHVRTSTLPPGHPPQSYGTGAFPPSYKIPGALSSNSNSGVTSGIAEEVASAPSTQPVTSALSLDSSKISRKRSRDDLNEEEETTHRPLSRFRIEGKPSSEAHIGSLGAAGDESNPLGNLLASSSGSSSLPSASPDSPPAICSSQRVKRQKIKKASKKK